MSVPPPLTAVPVENPTFQTRLFRSGGLMLLGLGFLCFVALIWLPFSLTPALFWVVQGMLAAGTALLCRARGSALAWGLFSPLVGLLYLLVVGEYRFHGTLTAWILPFYLLPFVVTDRREWKLTDGGANRRPRYLLRAFGLAPLTLTSPFSLVYGIAALDEARRENRSPTWALVATVWAVLWILLPIGLFLYWRTVSPDLPPTIASASVVRGEGVEAKLLPLWREIPEMKETPGTVLGVGFPEGELYLMVTRVPKANFVAPSLDAMIEKNISLMKGSFRPLRGAVGPQEVRLSDRRAVQYRLEGGLDNLAMTMLVTMTETSEHFVSASVWTFTERFERSAPELKAALENVRLTDR